MQFNTCWGVSLPALYLKRFFTFLFVITAGPLSLALGACAVAVYLALLFPIMIPAFDPNSHFTLMRFRSLNISSRLQLHVGSQALRQLGVHLVRILSSIFQKNVAGSIRRLSLYCLSTHLPSAGARHLNYRSAGPGSGDRIVPAHALCHAAGSLER
jgi:hypothetical protein